MKNKKLAGQFPNCEPNIDGDIIVHLLMKIYIAGN